MRAKLIGVLALNVLLQIQIFAQHVVPQNKPPAVVSPELFRELTTYCPGVTRLADGTINVPKNEKCQLGLRRLYAKHICQMEVAAQNAANYLTTVDVNGFNNPYRRRVVKTDGPGLPVVVEGNSPTRKVYCPWHPSAKPDGWVEIPDVNLLIENLDYEISENEAKKVLALIKQFDKNFAERHVPPISHKVDNRPIDERLRLPLK